MSDLDDFFKKKDKKKKKAGNQGFSKANTEVVAKRLEEKEARRGEKSGDEVPLATSMALAEKEKGMKGEQEQKDKQGQGQGQARGVSEQWGQKRTTESMYYGLASSASSSAATGMMGNTATQAGGGIIGQEETVIKETRVHGTQSMGRGLLVRL